jgi:hypothetical protein
MKRNENSYAKVKNKEMLNTVIRLGRKSGKYGAKIRIESQNVESL